MTIAVVTLDHVDKVHPLRTAARGRSLKQALLSLFRSKEQEQTVTALSDISLAVPKGKALGIVGSNGAGKSSLLRLIAGISEPTKGSVNVEGRILPMLELGAGFHPDLSGYENIFLQGTMLGLSRRHVEEVLPSIVEFSELSDFIHMPVSHYSSGMFMRLGFAISIHMQPDILLIDEAFSVGDIYFQEKCYRKILEFKQQGLTILLVTHDIHIVERLCDEVVWIDKGKIVAQGKPAEIAHRYKEMTFHRTYANPIPFVMASQTSVVAGRYGSGAATFDYLEFRDAEGNRCSVFGNGRPMEIRLRYKLRDPLPSMECLILVQSDRPHGPLSISTRDMQQTIKPHPEGGELVFRIDRLDLAPGAYQLSALLCKENAADVEDFYDFHLRMYIFYVGEETGTAKAGSLEMPCRWELLTHS